MTLFNWLEEITIKKSPVEKFSEEEWNVFNSYMVHRFLSMNVDYIDIVNYVQKINPQNKKQIYTIYKEMIPTKKVWLKYIKNEIKAIPEELVKYISSFYECSLKEAEQYILILKKPIVENILFKMGLNEKETKKLLK